MYGLPLKPGRRFKSQTKSGGTPYPDPDFQSQEYYLNNYSSESDDDQQVDGALDLSGIQNIPETTPQNQKQIPEVKLKFVLNTKIFSQF